MVTAHGKSAKIDRKRLDCFLSQRGRLAGCRRAPLAHRMLSFRLRGLVAAPFTPMHPDRSVHLERIPALADDLVANGIDGAFVLGTTGEGLSLTDEERRAVAAQWVRAAGGRLSVVVHVGHLSVTAAANLAAHAQTIGADAIATCGPFFYPIRSVRQVAAYCAEVAAAAPQLPFYYYHIPQMTHLAVSMVEFLGEAAPLVPTLNGIKYTHNDLEEYARLVEHADGQFDVAFGRDEILLQGLAAGATAAIGSTFNFVGTHFRTVLNAWLEGDVASARRAQARGAELIRSLRRHGGLSAMKATMEHIGLDCGPVRAPLRPLDADVRASLARELAAWGLPPVTA
jgi:N-acetylneuraminate lyase